MKIYQVDSFTEEVFKGNPAGVLIVENEISEDLMQNIAMEMNLAETAFLKKENDYYNLRWFTPTTEVNLCGHATLASAHILWESKREKTENKIKFSTKSGILIANRENDKIVLDFPIKEDLEIENIPKLLKEALKEEIVYCGKNDSDYIVELKNEDIVRSIKPDLSLLKNLDIRGLILTSKSNDEKYDFISRFFAPGCGIDEDPVTGSAHCCLAPFWRNRLKKSKFNAYQASNRGGSLEVEIVNNRILLKGRAVTFLEADIK